MAFTVSERKTSSLIFDKVLNSSLANFNEANFVLLAEDAKM